jgi:hypothetical protein
MSMTLTATFDGQVLRPDEPLLLPANTKVRLTIEPSKPSSAGASFLRTARSLKLDGPPDWSERLEDYMYGSDSDEK